MISNNMRRVALVACVLFLAIAGRVSAKDYHVALSGDDAAVGNARHPLKTISEAAARAQAGDTVTVHAGIYREWVNPPRGGLSEEHRIVYQAAPGAEVVIKGSEEVNGWTHVEAGTWKLTLPNSYFGDYNPYGDRLAGAWYEAKQAYHTGEVYIDGHWLREAADKTELVKSLARGNADAGAAELMNIQSFSLGQGGTKEFDDFFDASEGVQVVTDDLGKRYLGRMSAGSFVGYEMDFGEESKYMSVLAASPIAGGFIELRKDSVDGELIGRIDVGFTAEWTHFQRFHLNISPISGVHRIYCVFKARPKPRVDPSKDIGSWFAEVGAAETTIWADFKGKDPNQEFVEINVRKAVFYPEKEGINYITVRGFTLEQSANSWTAPTAEQVGLIGTHWSKGWVIEDNTIRYAVCVGVTLGKHGDEHDHTYDYNFTSIPKAIERGWRKDNIGSHIVRNNHIYNCGQGGIQGSLGCSFSTIEGNVIHDIRKDHVYGGCETAGIKLHGAVDVLIRDNHVYNCEHWGGIWLDWMAQGARVSGNLLHGNSQDLMFEVNHGPHLVDNNLLLSGRYSTDASGGGAFVHNLWYGNVNIWPDLRVRKTPYFKPHSVEIIDRIDVDQDDDRFYNNVFVGGKGTAVYDESGITIAAEGNVFVAGAVPSKNELNFVHETDFKPEIQVIQEDDGWWLEMQQVPFGDLSRELVTTEILGIASVPDVPFEDRNGRPYQLDTDYFGVKRDSTNPTAGAIEASQHASLRVKVWPKD